MLSFVKFSIGVLFLFTVCSVAAQGTIDQESIRPLIENQHGPVELVAKVSWHIYNVSMGKSDPYDSVRMHLERHLELIGGHYGSEQRLQIIELANRMRLEFIREKTQLIIPDYFFSDYRAYTPYPFFYPNAVGLPKLFIIDKFTQTFGAYEYGTLVHWGLLSSGKSAKSTPEGRYNFNWKTYYKLSNAAPKGVEWHLYWVYDFYAKIGLHVHQYPLPISAPASHGCVRVARPDAQWNYNWANGWVRDKHGKLLRNGTPVMVINNNPYMNKASHWGIAKNGQVMSLVKLPDSFDEIPLGSIEQRSAPWESGW